MRGEVRFDGVARRFGRTTALAGVDVAFRPGVRVGIVGESGSGKSTLARLLVGLDTPSQGRVTYDGQDLSAVLRSPAGRRDYWRDVQFVQQDTTSAFDPRCDFRDALTSPARHLLGASDAEADDLVRRTVVDVGLAEELLDRRPDQLSGGQRQRMAIARALVVRPSLLVCDEAVSALDVSVQGRVLNLLKTTTAATGAGLVFISHGLPATAFATEHLIVMYRGRIVEQGSTHDLLRDPRDPYTTSLVASYRDLAGDETTTHH